MSIIIFTILDKDSNIQHVIKGNVQKIEKKIEVKNAVEILESKNEELKNKYIEINTAICNLKKKIEVIKKVSDKNKSDTEKYTTYTNMICKMNFVLDKMSKTKENIEKTLVSHRSQIELVKSKLTYLETLKSLNEYTKDIKIDDCFDNNGIIDNVDELITQQEVVLESFETLNLDNL